jgi:formylglycine-generating enzyme required for sulfatase activity
VIRVFSKKALVRVCRGFFTEGVNVSWDDAMAYCNWVSKITGKTYRLPTEAEWEYSARGNEAYKFAGSDNVENVGWVAIKKEKVGYISDRSLSNNTERTHPVGNKKANGFGLYDMTGNVWEWCYDTNKSYVGHLFFLIYKYVFLS